ncbi:MAG: GTP cyclohydrolase I FolE [Planctomycetota bacterium]|nr:MAG: GTP cyclohydrolase I FolE [Planctomycetota bacterium]
MTIKERLQDLDFIESIGENHVGTSADTPIKPDAFALSDEQKIKKIKENFTEIMETLGLDLTDDSLSGTPSRVAKMFVKEIFQGLDPKNKPEMKTFENSYNYNEMLIEKDITVHSTCEHHFLPIVGRAHVAYISSGRVVGLSKLNRIVNYFAKRPQVQERLTQQIGKELQISLKTEHVAVLIDAAHLCVSSRGVQDVTSSTITSFYSGKFKEDNTKREFLDQLKNKSSAL